jgi:hypothetical protein
MLGMLQVPKTVLNKAQLKRVSLVAAIRDGQLAWISVLWNIGAIYEMLEHVDKAHAGLEPWMWANLPVQVVLILRGMSTASNGAITAGYNDKNLALLYSSIAITLISGILFILTYTQVHL